MSRTWTIGDHSFDRLGFGSMRLTGQGIWGDPDDRVECHKVLKRTLDLGVTFIDTADSYGPDVSETIIAEALYPYPEELFIASKAGLMRGGPDDWRPNGRPDHLRSAVEGSLGRLRLEQIELLQFHRPDPDVPFEESLGALIELQQEGKIKHIGVCNVKDNQLSRALAMVPIVSVQNRFNLEDRRSDGIVDRCEAEGIAFIPWAPLGSGEWRSAVEPLDAVAGRLGAKPNQVALAWLLARSPVVVPIPGTSSVSHLEENVAARDLELSADDYGSLDNFAE